MADLHYHFAVSKNIKWTVRRASTHASEQEGDGAREWWERGRGVSRVVSEIK